MAVSAGHRQGLTLLITPGRQKKASIYIPAARTVRRVHSPGTGLGRLRQYKTKFEPAWEDRFLVYDRSLFALPRISLAMTRSL